MRCHAQGSLKGEQLGSGGVQLSFAVLLVRLYRFEIDPTIQSGGADALSPPCWYPPRTYAHNRIVLRNRNSKQSLA